MDFNAVETTQVLTDNHLTDNQWSHPRPATQIERTIANGDSGLSDQSQATAAALRRQRRFSRYRFDVRIQASVFRDGLTASCWGRTNELGQDGIGATLSGEFQVGEVVSLEFPLPLPPHEIKLRAIVRYCAGLRCGFEFLIVNDEQRLLLRQICVMLANAS
jgi:hypothetical protein